MSQNFPKGVPIVLRSAAWRAGAAFVVVLIVAAVCYAVWSFLSRFDVFF